MIIGVNCGHTVSSTIGSGAMGYLNESNETRRVGYRLMELLRERGVEVVDCTNDYASSVSENLREIVAIANAYPLDLFISIHFNSGGGKGTEVYTYGGERLRQAEAVCENMEALGFVNRGIKNGSGLYVIRNSTAPAMLVEVCFVDTKSDADLYSKLGVDAIALAICDAVAPQGTGGLTMTQYEELKRQIAAQESAIDELRNSIFTLENPMIYNYIDENMPEWAHEAVRWCIDNGIIFGTGEGLGLNYVQLWSCVVIYRLAKHLER